MQIKNMNNFKKEQSLKMLATYNHVDILKKALDLSKTPKWKKVMEEFDEGKLKTVDGKVVTDRKQAMAIAFSESQNIEKDFDLGGELVKGKEAIVGEIRMYGGVKKTKAS